PLFLQAPRRRQQVGQHDDLRAPVRERASSAAVRLQAKVCLLQTGQQRIQRARLRQQLNVEQGTKSDVGVERFDERSSAEQYEPLAGERVDGALEAHQLHHRVVDRALIDGQE